MDSMTGMALARALDPETLPLIVFVTAYDHYALEAFEVSAVDYLLKPFDDARFKATVARVRRRHEAADGGDRQRRARALLEQLERGARARSEVQPRVLAEAGSRMHMLDVAQVEVVEADRNYVRLTIGRESFHARSTLQQAEKSFQSQPMLRISRSCLVNMRHVREVSRTPRGDFILVVARRHHRHEQRRLPRAGTPVPRAPETRSRLKPTAVKSRAGPPHRLEAL